MWWSRTSLVQGLWHNNCLCYFWGSRILTNKCCTRRSCRFCQKFNKWRLITTRSTNHMCWVANNWSIMNLLWCKTSVGNAKEYWVFSQMIAALSEHVKRQYDKCSITLMSGKHLTQTYSSDCHHRCHHDMGLFFLSGQRSATERTSSTACSRTDENMAVWHAAILSKIDNQ